MAHNSTNATNLARRSRTPVRVRMRRKGSTPSSTTVLAHCLAQEDTDGPCSSPSFNRPAFDTFARYPPPGGGYKVDHTTPQQQPADLGSFTLAVGQMQQDLKALAVHGAELGILCDPIRAAHAYRAQLEAIQAAHNAAPHTASNTPISSGTSVSITATPPPHEQPSLPTCLLDAVSR